METKQGTMSSPEPSQEQTNEAARLQYLAKLCAMQDHGKEPLFEMMQEDIDFASTQCKKAIAYIREHAETEPKPNILAWQKSLMPSVHPKVKSIQLGFLAVGCALPLEILRDDFPWVGQPRITKQVCQRIPGKLRSVCFFCFAFPSRMLILNGCSGIRGACLQKFVCASTASEWARTQKNMMAAIYRWVPKNEYDVAVRKSECAVRRKQIAESLRKLEIRLERLICADPSCKRFVAHPRVCGGCRTLGYCGAECQKRHWKVHKPDCRDVAERKELAVNSERAWFNLEGRAPLFSPVVLEALDRMKHPETANAHDDDDGTDVKKQYATAMASADGKAVAD